MNEPVASLYRHLPITVEARQVNAADWDLVEDIAAWCGGEAMQLEDFVNGKDTAVIFVPDTDDEALGSYAEDDDWIVRNGNGSFDVYAPDAFATTFTPVVQR